MAKEHHNYAQNDQPLAKVRSKISKNAEETPFQRIETVGLKYIERKRNSLLISLMAPIGSGLILLLSLLFIGTQTPPPPPAPPDAPWQNWWVIPSILFIGICIFVVVKIGMVATWHKDIRQYRLIPPQSQLSSNSLSLSKILYRTNRSMGKISNMIYPFMLVFFVLILWLIQMFETGFAQNYNIDNFGPAELYTWLNIGSAIGLFHYLVYEIKANLQWTRKAQRLMEFENKMFEDVKMDADDE